jgi:AcrR family transcriptional regulator
MSVPSKDARGMQDADQDGRALRRERNRAAVIDTVIALMDEGIFDPAVIDIVQRSHVSERSIFRYFDHLDDLRHAVIARILERGAPLLSLDALTGLAVDERIRGFVAARVRLWELQCHAARLARSREHHVPTIAEDLRRFRDLLRLQTAELFGPELQALARRERDHVLGTIFVLSSFESWDLHSRVLGWQAAQIERSLTLAIRALVP